MRRVYLDSAPVIYLVEQTPAFYGRVRALLQQSDWLVVSDVPRVATTRRQCALLQDFDDFFAYYLNEVVALTTKLSIRQRRYGRLIALLLWTLSTLPLR